MLLLSRLSNKLEIQMGAIASKIIIISPSTDVLPMLFDIQVSVVVRGQGQWSHSFIQR